MLFYRQTANSNKLQKEKGGARIGQYLRVSGGPKTGAHHWWFYSCPGLLSMAGGSTYTCGVWNVYPLVRRYHHT